MSVWYVIMTWGFVVSWLTIQIKIRERKGMIELIAICQNNVYMAAVIGAVILLAILLTMYIMQAVKDIKAIPTPAASGMILISFMLAGGITEIGSYFIVHFWSGIGILGALAEAAIYTYYKGISPEQQFLTWIVKQTAGRVTALVDKNAPTDPAITQDYKHE